MKENSLKPADFSERKAALLARILEAEGIQTEQERRIPRRADPHAYPLSAGQRRMWLLDQIEQGVHYNESLNLRLKGAVDIAILERTLQEILRRHEAMRSTFPAPAAVQHTTFCPGRTVPRWMRPRARRPLQLS